MKNMFRILLYIGALSLLLAGCKKDKDSSPNNYIKHGDVVYELSQGYWENYGKPSIDKPYLVEITLLSSGIKLYESNSDLDSLAGNGQVIKFTLLNNSPDTLALGDYLLNKESRPGTFEFGGVWLNADSQSKTGERMDFTDGKVTIKMNGSESEIIFDCTVEGGKTISGYFKGSLKYFNNDD